MQLRARMADATCACADTRCVTQVVVAARRRLGDGPEGALTDEERSDIRASNRRGAACYMALRGPDDPPTVEAWLEKFADEVCGCANEPKCIAAANERLHNATFDPASHFYASPSLVTAVVQRAISCGWQPGAAP